ncbi:DNA-directed RNA polymerase subunit H [Candidatus Woesearchaeota archaeon]|nr:DNA-directed RNA polymerase subunit H [Candidatus Woesearchaeota archaeon]
MDEINIQKHILVSEHTKLSDSEKKELLEKYNVSLVQLPKIFKNDAAIKNLDLKVGDVVKIKRNSPTAGEEFYFYRLVIDGK